MVEQAALLFLRPRLSGSEPLFLQTQHQAGGLNVLADWRFTTGDTISHVSIRAVCVPISENIAIDSSFSPRMNKTKPLKGLRFGLSSEENKGASSARIRLSH